MDPTETHTQSTWLAAAGAAFVALALYFFWRDLGLPRELVMLAAALATGVATLVGRPRRWPVAAPAALLGTSVASGLWYLAEKPAALLPALVIALAAAGIAVLRAPQRPAPPARALADRVTWYALGASLLASTWAFYFHFLTAGVASESVARRLVPTLLWLALGLAFFIAGKLRAKPASHVGLGLVAVALTKAIAYDTTHLHGSLRVAVLAAVGALLLFAARGLRGLPASGGGPASLRKEVI